MKPNLISKDIVDAAEMVRSAQRSGNHFIIHTVRQAGKRATIMHLANNTDDAEFTIIDEARKPSEPTGSKDCTGR